MDFWRSACAPSVRVPEQSPSPAEGFTASLSPDDEFLGKNHSQNHSKPFPPEDEWLGWGTEAVPARRQVISQAPWLQEEPRWAARGATPQPADFLVP